MENIIKAAEITAAGLEVFESEIRQVLSIVVIDETMVFEDQTGIAVFTYDSEDTSDRPQLSYSGSLNHLENLQGLRETFFSYGFRL